MSSAIKQTKKAYLYARDIGGIDETDLQLEPGVNVLTGRNATNRTSTLQALMAALGSSEVSLKADAEEGEVELKCGDETYTRTLTRTDGDIVLEGKPLLDDSTIADLYAFLLDENEARQAVSRGDDLRDIIMRPVDTDAIEAEIRRLEQEKRDLSERLEELSDLEDQVSELEAEKQRLEQQLDETRARLQEKEVEIEERDVDFEETQEEKAELESKLDELQDVRSELERIRRDIEMERKSIDGLRDELEEYREQESDLSEMPVDRAEELESEIDHLRRQEQSLEADINELQNIVQFNQEMVDGGGADVLATFETDEFADSGSVTDQLLEDQQITCWTCGSSVEKQQIKATTERLQEFVQSKRAEYSDVKSRIEELTDRQKDLRDQQRERERLERRIRKTEDEVEDREQRISELEDEREELEAAVSTLETEVESLRNEEYDEILELHREANQLEFDCEQLLDEIEEKDAEMESTREKLEERELLEEQRAEIQSELTDLRTRVERIETNAIEAFNEHMNELLDILGYTNLDRIWLERTATDVREGRQKVTKATFDLHVVRSTDSGTAYEDTIDHLSESEREVTGIVFALAGYLVHDVHDEVPFMLLDSLEAIDSERIASLIEYFESHVEYLVVALLPEDSKSVSDEYRRITEF